MEELTQEQIEAEVAYCKKLERIKTLNNWFNTDYTTYEQMLTRRAYLGIDDEIVDEFRQKTYKSLKDLYEEAEVVAKEIKELK